MLLHTDLHIDEINNGWHAYCIYARKDTQIFPQAYTHTHQDICFEYSATHTVLSDSLTNTNKHSEAGEGDWWWCSRNVLPTDPVGLLPVRALAGWCCNRPPLPPSNYSPMTKPCLQNAFSVSSPRGGHNTNLSYSLLASVLHQLIVTSVDNDMLYGLCMRMYSHHMQINQWEGWRIVGECSLASYCHTLL